MHISEEESSKVVYVHNIIPHKVLGNKTLEQVFTRNKQEVGYLRISVYPMFIHVPKENIMKLEHSGKKGTFIGYSETSKYYRIYIP
jgi:hypothetical protein